MDIINFPNGFRPEGSDFLRREQNKSAEFARLREQLGRGIVDGLQITRQMNGGVILSAGHGNDAAGRAIVVPQAITLDLGGVTMPAVGRFRRVAVLLEHLLLAQGKREDCWAERIDSVAVKFIEGVESESAAEASSPDNDSNSLRIGDILYDDNGTRSVDTASAEYLSSANQALGVPLDLTEALGGRKPAEFSAGTKLSCLWRSFPALLASLSEHWAEGIEYAVGQTKLRNGTQYICAADHTATAANAPGSADGDAFWAEQKTSAEQEAYARSQDSSLRSELQDRFYPVGSIYMNYNNPENPAILLGFGTWAALPTNYFLAQAGDRYEAGSEYEEGLPNITGSLIFSTRADNGYVATDSFYHCKTNGWYFRGGPAWMADKTVKLSASRCSETYGRHGDQVNPHTIGVFMWRRVA